MGGAWVGGFGPVGGLCWDMYVHKLSAPGSQAEPGGRCGRGRCAPPHPPGPADPYSSWVDAAKKGELSKSSSAK